MLRLAVCIAVLCFAFVHDTGVVEGGEAASTNIPDEIRDAFRRRESVLKSANFELEIASTTMQGYMSSGLPKNHDQVGVSAVLPSTDTTTSRIETFLMDGKK